MAYDESAAAAAVSVAFDAIQRVERLMHPTRPGSDLVTLGNAQLGVAVELDPWTCEVLEIAREMHTRSGGAFDPCLASAPGRLHHVDIEASRVTCRERVHIDLGGIAKGYAVDAGVAALRRLGCVAGIVNAGGDLRVFGAAPRSVAVHEASVTVELLDAALAASGPRGADSPPEHRGFYDGRDGRPVAGRHVAVIAPTAVIADALCKCALLCEAGTLDDLFARYGARFVQ